jgi:acyl-coenzyme A synthetase/AMP-(fatty) acid ligase
VDGHYFKLVGRHNDLVNIGGKRGSLSDLTKKLKAIEGVTDAVFFMPDEINGKRARLAAFVVVENTDIKKIRKTLSEFVDSVFIPRPLIILDYLPYNESGKLPRAVLLDFLDMHLKKYDYQDIA